MDRCIQCRSIYEFMEQRAPGHTVWMIKYLKMDSLILKKISKKVLANLDLVNDPNSYDKKEELKAIEIAADALINFADRYSQKAKLLAEKEQVKKRKTELLEISRICKKVPKHAPETFMKHCNIIGLFILV